MSQFEFFMTFYGLLLGLGVAELMSSLASLLRERTPPRLGLRTPLMALLILTEMLANFVDAWKRLQSVEIALLPLLIPTLIGLAYFVVAVIVIPRDLHEWTSLDDYFDRRRRWLAGLLIVVNILINAQYPHTLANILAGQWGGAEVAFVLLNLWLLGWYLVLFASGRRWLQVTALIANLLFYPVAYSGLFEAFGDLTGASRQASGPTLPLELPRPPQGPTKVS